MITKTPLAEATDLLFSIDTDKRLPFTDWFKEIRRRRMINIIFKVSVDAAIKMHFNRRN